MRGHQQWIAERLRDFWPDVTEIDGWQERGSPEFDPLIVVDHWTGVQALGNMPSLRLLVNGRPDLAGPLCQVGIGRDGTQYVIAAGRANHAGAGVWAGISGGNTHGFGIEAEYHPNEGAWPQVQLDSITAANAALRNGPHRHIDASMICGHFEYALPSGRKIDPNNLDMDAMRYASGVLDPPATPPPPPPPPPPAVETRPTLRLGSQGQAVRDWQFYLQDVTGQHDQSGWDGIFGANTERFTRNFQRFFGLTADGVVGPHTWQTMDAVRAARP